MKPIKQIMNFSKSTPGTHFYAAPDQSTAKVKTQYIQKTAFEGATPPATIEVTIVEVKA